MFLLIFFFQQVAELLTGENLYTQLRVPAVSRLQKVHNTDVALKALRKAAASLIPSNILAKDLVDGHREKTLTLLWSLIFGFQLSALIDVARLREEVVHLRKSLRVRARLGDQLAVRGESWLAELRTRSPPLSADSALEGEAVALLKTWSQLVTAHYDIQVSLSFALVESNANAILISVPVIIHFHTIVLRFLFQSLFYVAV
jgi:abnormal spindle-like microcephaly-associated protein